MGRFLLSEDSLRSDREVTQQVFDHALEPAAVTETAGEITTSALGAGLAGGRPPLVRRATPRRAAGPETSERFSQRGEYTKTRHGPGNTNSLMNQKKTSSVSPEQKA